MKNLIFTIGLCLVSLYLTAADDSNCCIADNAPTSCQDACPSCELECGSWSCGCVENRESICGFCNTTQGSLDLCSACCCYCTVTEPDYLSAINSAPEPQAMEENSAPQ